MIPHFFGLTTVGGDLYWDWYRCSEERSQLLEGERVLCCARLLFLYGISTCEEVGKDCRCCGGKIPEEVRAQ